ncbi:hypothetical protein OOK60_06915 [Trichothermofontia sichuanensis B231]|uniref:hypothetical protein n=1 Tax=Trichothermofontia sichuanensis TaxID=3045816 RepID=UPI0022486F03|nr:hypothetical protein [Trichothermofontia sichuanensis]UZQ55795.1 hypothetical protein OOK60_06915 [Trichothermofontia sichuanensis B231]
MAIELYPNGAGWHLWRDALVDNEAALLGNGNHLERVTINLEGQGDAIDRIPTQFLNKQGFKIKRLEILLGALAIQWHGNTHEGAINVISGK